MNLGSRVRLLNKSLNEYGKIVDIKNIFGKRYYSVYFEENSKFFEVHEDEVELEMGITDKFLAGKFESLEEFILNNMGNKLSSLIYSQLGIVAGNFKIKPLPHQIVALNFVLNKFSPRCLLADEVGLGKTIEAALIYEEMKLRGMGDRILIICPASLGKQWQEELKVKFNEEFFLMNKEGANSLKSLYGEKGNIWHEYDKVICSMDFLKPKKVSENLSEKERKRRDAHNKRIFQDAIDSGWDIVIIDEAHKLTKEDEATARYRMGKAFSETVPVFLLLTATPHRGKPEVFKSLLQLIDEEMFATTKDINPENVSKVCIRNNKRATVDMEGKRLFKDRVTDICVIRRDNPEDEIELELYNAISSYVSEYYNYAQQENNSIMMFLLIMYQRIVSSSSSAVLSSLRKRYEKLETTSKNIENFEEVTIDDILEKSSEDQVEILEENKISLRKRELIKREKSIILECIELAQKACNGRSDSKLKMLLKIVDEIKIRENKNNIKIIIFTEFKETQKYLKKSLENLGYKIAIINGSLSLEEKMNQKDYFREEADFLISTDAGGEGLNLQFSSHMVNYDIPWNPMMLEQRIGRIDRIGQKEIVKIFNFVIKDSIEEKVRETLENKLQVIKEQFGTDQVKDILSTLEEEFSFDKIYIDAIRFREKQGKELEEIAQKLYEEAKDILNKNQFLLPFTEQKEMDIEQKNILETLPGIIKRFVKNYLEINYIKLEEYKDRKEVYYFKNPFKLQEMEDSAFRNIIFDSQVGVEYENVEIMGIQNDFIKKLIKQVKSNGKISSFSIKNEKFAGKKGILGFYKLSVKNNGDFKKELVFPIFIDSETKYNSRISGYLENINFDEIFEYKEKDFDYDSVLKKLEETSNILGEEKFINIKIDWQERLNEKFTQMDKYYFQKNLTIEKIAINNIRESKIKKIKEEQSLEKEKYLQEMELFPELECLQLALVSFGE